MENKIELKNFLKKNVPILLQVNRQNREKIFLDDIIYFEKKYNSVLSTDYKDFLLEYNGGIIGIYKTNDEYFSIENKYMKDKTCSIADFYTLDLISSLLDDEDENYYHEILNLNLLPIACDDGYYHELFIGTGKNNFGKIYFYEIGFLDSIEYLCNSFTDLINAFYLLNEDN